MDYRVFGAGVLIQRITAPNPITAKVGNFLPEAHNSPTTTVTDNPPWEGGEGGVLSLLEAKVCMHRTAPNTTGLDPRGSFYYSKTTFLGMVMVSPQRRARIKNPRA